MTVTTRTYRYKVLTQISISVEGFERKALLSHFKGERDWAARGRLNDGYGTYDIVLHDGPNTRLRKAQALEVAERFVRTGREFL